MNDRIREIYVSANRTFFDLRKRTKLRSECAHWRGFESANRHSWKRILSTKFVCWESRSQSSHYTNACESYHARLNVDFLLCSAKHLLICRDATATADIYVHFFGVTLTVTASSREQQRLFCDARIYTDYRTGHSVRKTVLTACTVPILSCLNVS